MLGPLQDNGGPTLTHAILLGSPVIDHGGACEQADQRGVLRPADGDGDGIGQCDTGAYEIASWQVTKTNDTDDGFCNDDCSLREAIIASNEAPGSDAVVVPAGTYTLSIPGTAENESTTGDLDITDDLHLTGVGVGVAVIDGGGLDRVIDIPGGTADTTVQISGLTIQNGTAGIHAIRSHLTLKNTAVSNNLGYGVEVGSPAFSTTLTLQNSLIAENSATGLWATHTDVLLSRSIVRQNNAPDIGGIYALSGTLTIQSSTILNNSGEIGGVSANAPFTVTRSAIISNTGSYGPGGLWVDFPGTITNSTISGNSGTEGAGIWAGQELTIHSSTIAQNTAVGIGTEPLETGNGGGIFTTEPITLQNSIVFSNTSSAGSPDCAGNVASQGYNMVGITTGCTITTTIGDLFGVDPLLEPLQNFAGFVWYHALPQESPAVDAGNPAGCTYATNILLTNDQRGFPRHIDGNEDNVPVCDIGAVEFFVGFTLYMPVISR
jgi:CSLREA domain-containing protein